MRNIKTLNPEIELHVLICGLWGLDLLEPTFFKNVNQFNSNLIHKHQNLGFIKHKSLKDLYDYCKLVPYEQVIELLNLLQFTTDLEKKSNCTQELPEDKLLKKYVQRFKFFYLYNFENLELEDSIEKDLNMAAISVLFFLVL